MRRGAASHKSTVASNDDVGVRPRPHPQNEPASQPIAAAMTPYLKFEIHAASRLRTPYGWPHPGIPAIRYSHDSRPMPPLFHFGNLPFPGKARLLSLNTQTPCPPRGAGPSETKFAKDQVWMRLHERCRPKRHWLHRNLQWISGNGI